MAFSPDKVHKLEKDHDGRGIITATNPYIRYVSEGNPPLNLQGGRFYYDNGTKCALSDVPGEVRKLVDDMSKETRKEYKVPEAGFKWSDDVQILNDEDEEVEPEAEAEPQQLMTIVDAVYELDPANDLHWTKDGKPQLAPISKALNNAHVTRDEVEELTNGYRRPIL
jgi:hypothetical protein